MIAQWDARCRQHHNHAISAGQAHIAVLDRSAKSPYGSTSPQTAGAIRRSGPARDQSAGAA
jgi:hypothetical protein